MRLRISPARGHEIGLGLEVEFLQKSEFLKLRVTGSVLC